MKQQRFKRVKRVENFCLDFHLTNDTKTRRKADLGRTVCGGIAGFCMCLAARHRVDVVVVGVVVHCLAPQQKRRVDGTFIFSFNKYNRADGVRFERGGGMGATKKIWF